MPEVLDTGKIGQDGQAIHPVLFNTAKDGSGTWYVALVDADGKVIISPVAISAGTNLIGKVGIDQTTLGTTNGVVRVKGGLSNSGVLQTDGLVKNGAGAVYWLSVSDIAALAIELNDSPTGTGTDKWAIDIPAGGYAHFIFDPPIEFAEGIYLDVSTTSCKVTVGYI